MLCSKGRVGSSPTTGTNDRYLAPQQVTRGSGSASSSESGDEGMRRGRHPVPQH